MLPKGTYPHVPSGRNSRVGGIFLGVGDGGGQEIEEKKSRIRRNLTTIQMSRTTRACQPCTLRSHSVIPSSERIW